MTTSDLVGAICSFKFSFMGNLKLTAMACIAAITITSCSQKMRFAKSLVVPGAEGTVKVKKDNNSNYNVHVNVLHLAHPKDLQQPKKTYVVWMKSKDNAIKNIGQIKTASGFWSKTLKASLSTTTSFAPASFFITAEDIGEISTPGTFTVLTTEK
jgi:hypothetical protein